jgi:hypothetical protein
MLVVLVADQQYKYIRYSLFIGWKSLTLLYTNSQLLVCWSVGRKNKNFQLKKIKV